MTPRTVRRWSRVDGSRERSLRRALSEYVEHFHAERNHQGKGNVLLFPRDSDICHEGPVQSRERLGGLLRYYHREAA
jgi:putative transposase